MKLIPYILQAILILFALAIDRRCQSSFTNPPECGRRIDDIRRERLNKIAGGQQAVPEDWGWQVALYIRTFYVCGGTLIDNEWVITSAECFFEDISLSSYILFFGLHNRSEPESYSIKRTLTEFIVHPQYTEENNNNIALLKLSSPVEYTDQILPICLPSQNYDFSDQMSWATGWGYLEFQGKTSNILMEMQSKILNDSMCEERYKNLGVSVFNSSINVCAGGNGKSICTADSGGPLVVNVSGKWQLAGISSWTNGNDLDKTGCDDGGIFVEISFYIDWILSYIQKTISFSPTTAKPSEPSSTQTNSSMNKEFSTLFSEIPSQRTGLPNTMESPQSESPSENPNKYSTGTFSSAAINETEFSILIKKIIKLAPTGGLRSIIVGDTDLTELESLLNTLIPLSNYSAYDEIGIIFFDATVLAYLNSESEIGSLVSNFFSILKRNEQDLKQKAPSGYLMSIEKPSTISVIINNTICFIDENNNVNCPRSSTTKILSSSSVDIKTTTTISSSSSIGIKLTTTNSQSRLYLNHQLFFEIALTYLSLL